MEENVEIYHEMDAENRLNLIHQAFPVLEYFEFTNYDVELHLIAGVFHMAAFDLVNRYVLYEQDVDKSQIEVALYKLLEARDAAVRGFRKIVVHKGPAPF